MDNSRIGFPDFPLSDSLQILGSESASTVDKKKAMESIARKRDPSLKAALVEYLGHPNPEVVMQAVRGLFVFKDDPEVDDYLQALTRHPNDLVRDVAELEWNKGINLEDDHPNSPPCVQNVVVHGDVREVLQHVPSHSIHLTFTSPPYYNARDYSIYRNYDEYMDFLEGVFTEVHRITKEGRFLVVNSSPVIMSRAARQYRSRRYAIPFDLHARLMSMGDGTSLTTSCGRNPRKAWSTASGHSMRPASRSRTDRTKGQSTYSFTGRNPSNWSTGIYASTVKPPPVSA